MRLAREAVKGRRNRGGRQSWIDWLELLSCAEDEDTGKRHYSVMEGSSYSPEKAFQRDRAAGDEAEAPRNALVEYRLTSQGGLEKGRRWYTRSPRIENLFAKSAGQCLELRSLVPQRADAAVPDRTKTGAKHRLDGNPESPSRFDHGVETAKIPADRTTPFNAVVKGVIPTGPPSQLEIEKYADEVFTAGIEDRIDEYAKYQAQVLAEARLTNNVGAYLPALIRCKKARLRTEILLLADAWVESATIYAVALGNWAHKALEKTAIQMAGGTNSAIRGELDRHATRTRTPQSSAGGEREIHTAMKSALREAKLRLNTQRIKAERSLRHVPPLPVQSGFESPKTHKSPPPDNMGAESVAERAQRRKAVLDPILKDKVMNVNQWADAASVGGLSHSTVFRYYNGETNPRINTLQTLASPLGLKAEDLPR